MIDIKLVGDRELVGRLTSLPSAIRRELTIEMQKQGLALQRHVQLDKLSGQVLHVVSGVLRSSINLKIDQHENSIVASVGTNVRYAAVHEYGFDGNVNVRAFDRTVNVVFGRAVGSTVQHVRAHVRHMRIPERSYLRSALADMQAQISEAMAAAVRRAIHG